MRLSIEVNTPPAGFEYTTEFRPPLVDEYYEHNGQAAKAIVTHSSYDPSRLILRKVKIPSFDDLVGKKFRSKMGTVFLLVRGKGGKLSFVLKSSFELIEFIHEDADLLKSFTNGNCVEIT